MLEHTARDTPSTRAKATGAVIVTPRRTSRAGGTSQAAGANTSPGTDSADASTTPAADPAAGQVSIDIPGVESTTHVGDLTVEQFVSLWAQLNAQLPAPKPKRADVEATVAKIRDMMNGDDDASDEVRAALRGAQKAILDNMPAMVRAAQGRAAGAKSRTVG